MPSDLFIPLAIFLGLLALFALLIRRVGLLVGESHEMASFGRATADLATRIDGTLASITVKIDRVRRRQIDATRIAADLDAALAELLAYGIEAKSLQGPPVTAPSRAAFLAEIDRAERALQMVEYGCSILNEMGGTARLGEAETAIKRGYLNVVHAREALARHASEIAAARPRDEMRWLTRRGRGQG
jgi:hypothetical protein